jgi:hypothetical protein
MSPVSELLSTSSTFFAFFFILMVKYITINKSTQHTRLQIYIYMDRSLFSYVSASINCIKQLINRQMYAEKI